MQYGEDMVFVSLNAADNGPGQVAFEALGLRGHPAIVLFKADGTETQRSVGIPDEDTLRQDLEGLLAN